MTVWLTTDPEYGSVHWLRREIATKLGYAADGRLLNRPERAYVDSIIESGVMQFAAASSPTVQPEEPAGEGRLPDGLHVEATKDAVRRAPYRWSFLNYVYSFQTVANQNTYDLPDDFGSFIAEPTTSREGGRIAIVGESHLRQLIGSAPASGPPAYCTTRKVSVGGESVAKKQLILYPTPMASETIQLEYGTIPQTLNDQNPYPPGGREHAETILASCCYVLAMRTGEGVEQAAAHLRDRLAASIVLDRAASKPTADGVWVEDDGKFNHSYLLRMIGRHLGYGPNQKAWSHQQTQLTAEVLRRTLRRVYNPPILPKENYPHDWTFLRPVASISTTAGHYLYDLPDDFAMLYGPMTHATEGSTLYPAIIFVGEIQIRQLLQRQEATARPDRAAVRVKSMDRANGTRYELLLWPVPDQIYQLDYRYRINPNSINLIPTSETDLDIHGGDRYSEMFLEAAMLSADEMMGVKRSPHEERFMRAVMSAVGADRMTNAPDSLGYNGDPSQARRFGEDWHNWDENIVTLNGIAY